WAAPDHLPAYDRFPALDLALEQAKVHSPLEHVTPDDPPTLLVVGAKDELVPMSHSQNIHKAFEDKEVPTGLVVFDEAGHGFSKEDTHQALSEMVKWFQEHLSDK